MVSPPAGDLRGGGGGLQAGSWDGVAPDLALLTIDLIPRSPPVDCPHS